MVATFEPPVLHAALAVNAIDLCQPCDSEKALCLGGNHVQPNAGYWLLPEDRPKVSKPGSGAEVNAVVVYRCQIGSCKACRFLCEYCIDALPWCWLRIRALRLQ